MTDLSSFTVAYDAVADVLYISRQLAEASRGVEDRFGIVWRYDGSGELLSATVLDFHDRWAEREGELASALATKFDIPARLMLTVLEHVH